MLHIVSYRRTVMIGAGCCVAVLAMGGVLLATGVITPSAPVQVPPVQSTAQLHRHNTPVVVPTPSSSAAPPAAVAPDVHIPPVENGLVPVVTALSTHQPVVFLTIDDGAYKSPDELPMMQANHVTATLFLSRLFIGDNPTFFTDFMKAGDLIENHTLAHDINMVKMSYDQQKAEICGMADYEEQRYGRRPILYRPPGGSYNTTMRRAAAACGMKALVTWIAKANGGSMQYQVGDHLLPGDVVLMHFRPVFHQDMQAFLDAMNSQHLHTAQLEDWLSSN